MRTYQAWRSRSTALAAAVAIVAVTTACVHQRNEDERLAVAASVSPIADLVSRVAGDRALVTGLIPEGVDSHTFEPSPREVRALTRARLLFVNGLHLETPISELVSDLDDSPRVISLGDRAITRAEWIFDRSFPEDRGDPNPHLWTNPVFAIRFIEEIRKELSAVDPAGAAEYAANASRLTDRLRALDSAIRTATASLPPESRKLLTYHDSFPYFAREYGWTVIGAVQPADFKEPTAREVAQLIDQVRSNKVPAIFGSEVFPSPVLETIAKETGARYVADLRDDDLPGEEGDPEHSYIGLMRFNLITMIETLGGDASAIRSLEPSQ